MEKYVLKEGLTTEKLENYKDENEVGFVKVVDSKNDKNVSYVYDARLTNSSRINVTVREKRGKLVFKHFKDTKIVFILSREYFSPKKLAKEMPSNSRYLFTYRETMNDLERNGILTNKLTKKSI